jgi:hypothetical protein
MQVISVDDKEARLIQAVRALPEYQRAALLASAEQLRDVQYKKIEGAGNVFRLRRSKRF